MTTATAKRKSAARQPKLKAVELEAQAEDDSLIIFVRCNPEERDRFKAKFKNSGLRSYSEWVRQTLWNASAPDK